METAAVLIVGLVLTLFCVASIALAATSVRKGSDTIRMAHGLELRAERDAHGHPVLTISDANSDAEQPSTVFVGAHEIGFVDASTADQSASSSQATLLSGSTDGIRVNAGGTELTDTILTPSGVHVETVYAPRVQFSDNVAMSKDSTKDSLSVAVGSDTSSSSPVIVASFDEEGMNTSSIHTVEHQLEFSNGISIVSVAASGSTPAHLRMEGGDLLLDSNTNMRLANGQVQFENAGMSLSQLTDHQLHVKGGSTVVGTFNASTNSVEAPNLDTTNVSMSGSLSMSTAKMRWNQSSSGELYVQDYGTNGSDKMFGFSHANDHTYATSLSTDAIHSMTSGGTIMVGRTAFGDGLAVNTDMYFVQPDSNTPADKQVLQAYLESYDGSNDAGTFHMYWASGGAHLSAGDSTWYSSSDASVNVPTWVADLIPLWEPSS